MAGPLRRAGPLAAPRLDIGDGNIEIQSRGLPSLDCHRGSDGLGPLMPRRHPIGAGGEPLNPVGPGTIRAPEEPVRQDQYYRTHIRVDVAEYLHDARTVEHHTLGGPLSIAAQIEGL